MRNLARYLLYRWKYPGVIIRRNAVVARRFAYGPGVHIAHQAFLSNVTIGKYSYCGVRSQIANASVGSFCSIAQDVRVGLGMHPLHFVSTSPCLYASRASWATSFGAHHAFVEYGDVRIGNDVWIGAGAMIHDGVTVGDGAVISAGSVVMKDVPPYAIVIGVPAQVRSFRFPEPIVERLLAIEWWNWDDATIRARASEFSDVERFVATFGDKAG